MAITKSKKEEIVAKVKSATEQANSMVFVNFHGLGVEDEHALRRKLRDEGVSYYVAKKTLVKRVLEGSGFTGEIPSLEGELALAWSDDAVAPAREVYTFGKTNDAVKIIGGVFEGAFRNQSEMTEIATIPGMLQLRGMFVNVINSPIQGLAVALGQIAEKKTS